MRMQPTRRRQVSQIRLNSRPKTASQNYIFKQILESLKLERLSVLRTS